MQSPQLNYSNFNHNGPSKSENGGQFALIKRRDAVRLLKVHESNGHEYVAKFFSQPTFCSFCTEFLWYILFF